MLMDCATGTNAGPIRSSIDTVLPGGYAFFGD
jgi:hypothetical protein